MRGEIRNSTDRRFERNKVLLTKKNPLTMRQYQKCVKANVKCETSPLSEKCIRYQKRAFKCDLVVMRDEVVHWLKSYQYL